MSCVPEKRACIIPATPLFPLEIGGREFGERGICRRGPPWRDAHR